MIAKPVTAECIHKAVRSNAAWLTDAMLLLLCLMVLDRFADYVGDQVKAPVREAAAQALACAAAPLPDAAKLALLQLLVRLQQSPRWEVRPAIGCAVLVWLARALKTNLLLFRCRVQALS